MNQKYRICLITVLTSAALIQSGCFSVMAMDDPWTGKGPGKEVQYAAFAADVVTAPAQLVLVPFGFAGAMAYHEIAEAIPSSVQQDHAAEELPAGDSTGDDQSTDESQP